MPILSFLSNNTFQVPNRRNFDMTYTVAADSKDPRGARLRGDAFTPETSYFSVRIAEMRMASAGNYLESFLPMCTCFLRYRYGTQDCEVPFILNYDKIIGPLKQQQPTRGASSVAMLNTYVVRDVPVKVGGVSLFAALCRVTDSSFARGMLDLVGDAVEKIGGASVGLTAKAGIDMTKRLASLLGSGGVMTRFGVSDGDALSRSGYRVLAGADQSIDKLAIDMTNGKLSQITAQGTTATVDDADYLVLAIEYRKSLTDDQGASFVGLPFHQTWARTREKLLNGDNASADYDFRQLQAEIMASPDLVEADRFNTLASYVAQREAFRQSQSKAPVLRSGNRSLSSVLTDFAAAAKGTEAELLDVAAMQLNVLDGTLGAISDPLSDVALLARARGLSVAIGKLEADAQTWNASTTQLLAASVIR